MKINSPEKYLVASAAEMSNGLQNQQAVQKRCSVPLYHLPCYFHCTAYRSLPEWHIEYVMETKWDQCSLNKTKNQSSYITRTCYKTTQCINAVLHYRPYKVQQFPTNQYTIVEMIGTKRVPPKKRKCIRKLDSVESVVKCCHTKTYD